MPSTLARLWIVATPIGNLGDLSPRAREILSDADLVLAEDTRRAGRLLGECGISPVKLLSFFEHNEEGRLPAIMEKLRNGANVALISDAGTPLLADPGYRLVRACQREGIRVSPVPGACAPVAALSASGLPPIPFSFLGFLPRSAKGIETLLAAFATVPGSLVFFERKDRLAASLALALSILGDREIAICRELTKTHEEIIFGRLENYSLLCQNPLGEITVIIGPANSVPRAPENEVQRELKAELAQGIKNRQAAINVHARCAGWSVKEIYALIAEIKNSC